MPQRFDGFFVDRIAPDTMAVGFNTASGARLTADEAKACAWACGLSAESAASTAAYRQEPIRLEWTVPPHAAVDVQQLFDLMSPLVALRPAVPPADVRETRAQILDLQARVAALETTIRDLRRALN